MKITSAELRNAWLEFYKQRGHVDIGAVSLIGDGTTGVMFNVAGMQALMPYLLGKPHPDGKRLCNVQGCVRTVDIEEVGDSSHFTFFEMMGNWSLGDYFKEEKTRWTLELLTDVFGLDKDKICSTVFEGNDAAPRDDETANLLLGLGIKKENIFFLGKKDNWWELDGTVDTPCGPDNEWFYPKHDNKCGENCDINCSCHRYVEVGNDVYMQYKKTADGYVPLASKNVDTGFGLDRLLGFLNGVSDGYKTDLFYGAVKYLEGVSGCRYDDGGQNQRAIRIIADHVRTSTMLIGDKIGIVPSNTGAGYILRRLLRRAIRYTKSLNIPADSLLAVSKIFIDVYCAAYPLLVEKKDYILSEISKETAKFETTLTQGIKEFDKLFDGISRKNQFMATKDANYVPDDTIAGKQAFRLYDTFGFPLELTVELAAEKGLKVDTEGFNIAFAEHQEKSKAQAVAAKSGLAESGAEVTRLHTATHLLQAALRQVLGNEVAQKGSNITAERLRFDFSFGRPMTEEEIRQTEALVNKAIADALPVVMQELPLEEARKTGAIGLFGDKYGEVVRVYSVGNFSKELCSGPHVNNTSELGKFTIEKEQSSSSGVRRIKAVLS
jgi:alanyl-tRNA synthetase